MRPLDTDPPELEQRRALLRRAAWLLGGAISAPAALAFLQGCSARDDAAGEAGGSVFLDAAALAVVGEIAEIMIPRTTTSGARDAGVPAFIDGALAALYPATDQDRYRAGLAAFETAARGAGKAFLEQDPTARVELVDRTLKAALAGERDPKPFILMTRELALLGYFTSRPGITENMEYVPVPTAFHGCVPVSTLKKPVYWE